MGNLGTTALVNENRDLSELKKEKEELRDYYQSLKERREKILALKKIKDSKKRKKAIQDENNESTVVPLIFQDGEFKSKRVKATNLSLIPQPKNIKVQNQEVEQPRELKRTAPKPQPRPKEDEPTFKNVENYVKKPLKTTDFVIEDEDVPLLPSDQRGNLTRSIPEIVEPSLDLTRVINIPDEDTLPPLLGNQQDQGAVIPPAQQQVQPLPPNYTNIIQPESALVLEPFDKLKTEHEINEDAHSMMPKNSPLYVTTIVTLTVILSLLIIIIIVWGFASNWHMDINKFVDDLKAFFTIK